MVKTGRIHLMDAVPLTVGQKWSGWAHQIRDVLARIRAAETGLFELAAGGTAVGTGLNAPAGFGREIAAKIAELTGYPFVTAPNKFAAQGSLDGAVAAMGAVRGLAVALMKIANDMRCWHRDRVGVSASSCCRRTSRAPRRQPSRRRW